jgi:hypothetical protein
MTFLHRGWLVTLVAPNTDSTWRAIVSLPDGTRTVAVVHGVSQRNAIGNAKRLIDDGKLLVVRRANPMIPIAQQNLETWIMGAILLTTLAAWIWPRPTIVASLPASGAPTTPGVLP